MLEQLAALSHFSNHLRIVSHVLPAEFSMSYTEKSEARRKLKFRNLSFRMLVSERVQECWEWGETERERGMERAVLSGVLCERIWIIDSNESMQTSLLFSPL